MISPLTVRSTPAVLLPLRSLARPDLADRPAPSIESIYPDSFTSSPPSRSSNHEHAPLASLSAIARNFPVRDSPAAPTGPVTPSTFELTSVGVLADTADVQDPQPAIQLSRLLLRTYPDQSQPRPSPDEPALKDRRSFPNAALTSPTSSAEAAYDDGRSAAPVCAGFSTWLPERAGGLPASVAWPARIPTGELDDVGLLVRQQHRRQQR